VCVCLCVCVCVPVSVVRCNMYILHLKRFGKRGRNKKEKISIVNKQSPNDLKLAHCAMKLQLLYSQVVKITLPYKPTDS